jgi:DNA-binding beta-propeller fold protein YncE
VYSSRLAYLATWSRGGQVILGHHWFSPSAAAFAPDGTVWVTDRHNGLIRHLSATGEYLGVLTGGPSSTHASVAGHFADPVGVAVDGRGRVLVADTAHNRIQEFSPDGRLLASWSRPGAGDMGFREPHAVAVGPEGAVYVADTGNDRVVKLSFDGELLAAWGGGGVEGGHAGRPSGIAIDASGHVFVSDAESDRIREFTPGGRLLKSWGRDGIGPGEMSGPTGIAVDCRGSLFVADTQNNRVQVFEHAASACPRVG